MHTLFSMRVKVLKRRFTSTRSPKNHFSHVSRCLRQVRRTRLCKLSLAPEPVQHADAWNIVCLRTNHIVLTVAHHDARRFLQAACPNHVRNYLCFFYAGFFYITAAAELKVTRQVKMVENLLRVHFGLARGNVQFSALSTQSVK